MMDLIKDFCVDGSSWQDGCALVPGFPSRAKICDFYTSFIEQKHRFLLQKAVFSW